MTPYLLFENKVIVEVKLNGKALRAVLDTGANLCLMKEGGIEVPPGAETTLMAGAYGQTEVPLVEVARLTLLGQEFSGLKCGVVPEPSLRSLPPDVEFVVSNQVLAGQTLTLDPRFGQIGLGEQHLTQVVQEFRLEEHRGVHLLEGEFAGRMVRCLFDLGAALNVVNSRSPRVDLDQLIPLGSLAIADTSGRRRDQPLYGYDRPLRLAPLWGEFIGTAIDLTPLEATLGCPVDMILGLSSLLSSQMVWRVDYGRRQLTLGRGLVSQGAPP